MLSQVLHAGTRGHSQACLFGAHSHAARAPRTECAPPLRRERDAPPWSRGRDHRGGGEKDGMSARQEMCKQYTHTIDASVAVPCSCTRTIQPKCFAILLRNADGCTHTWTHAACLVIPHTMIHRQSANSPQRVKNLVLACWLPRRVRTHRHAEGHMGNASAELGAQQS